MLITKPMNQLKEMRGTIHIHRSPKKLRNVRDGLFLMLQELLNLPNLEGSQFVDKINTPSMRLEPPQVPSTFDEAPEEC
jgi:hypothetical protein